VRSALEKQIRRLRKWDIRLRYGLGGRGIVRAPQFEQAHLSQRVAATITDLKDRTRAPELSPPPPVEPPPKWGVLLDFEARSEVQHPESDLPPLVPYKFHRDLAPLVQYLVDYPEHRTLALLDRCVDLSLSGAGLLPLWIVASKICYSSSFSFGFDDLGSLLTATREVLDFYPIDTTGLSTEQKINVIVASLYLLLLERDPWCLKSAQQVQHSLLSLGPDLEAAELESVGRVLLNWDFDFKSTEVRYDRVELWSRLWQWKSSGPFGLCTCSNPTVRALSEIWAVVSVQHRADLMDPLLELDSVEAETWVSRVVGVRWSA
jgi:hypothetical protein